MHRSSFYVFVNNEQVYFRYLRDVPGVVGRFLKHVWDHADQGCIMASLKAIFNTISYIESSGLQPSLALGGIVKYIPTGLINKASFISSFLTNF